jgi:hypothetical protein
MKPRKRPTRKGVRKKAEIETAEYGEHQRYIPGLVAAGNFCEHHAFKDGLPEDWEFRQRVTVYAGDQQANWKIYIETVKGIRLAFAESEEGETLILLLVVPTRELKVRQALTEARKRL